MLAIIAAASSIHSGEASSGRLKPVEWWRLAWCCAFVVENYGVEGLKAGQRA